MDEGRQRPNLAWRSKPRLRWKEVPVQPPMQLSGQVQAQAQVGQQAREGAIHSQRRFHSGQEAA